MKKFYVLFIMVALMSSCSTATKQITADMISGVTSTAIIEVGTCESTDLIKSEVKAQMDDWFKLNQEKANKGIVGDICKLAVGEVLPKLLGMGATTLKPEWKCKLTSADNVLKLVADKACGLITK
jgi:hypothetical protein